MKNLSAILTIKQIKSISVWFNLKLLWILSNRFLYGPYYRTVLDYNYELVPLIQAIDLFVLIRSPDRIPLQYDSSYQLPLGWFKMENVQGTFYCHYSIKRKQFVIYSKYKDLKTILY